MRDALPFPIPLSERVSIIYLEFCVLDRDGHALVALSKGGKTILPVGRTTTIMLGPGTRVSHAAISLAALENCLLLWIGEAGVRLYASGNPRSEATKLVHQAILHADEQQRLAVARRCYELMFDEPSPERRSLEQLRGLEGSRVKKIYEALAAEHGLTWAGRSQDIRDPLNLAISTATAALYGISEALILALGYSPAIGFIHSGDPRSFVFDLADTMKFKTVVPMAFRLVKESEIDVERRVRISCREVFLKTKVVDSLILNLETMLNADGRT